MSFETYATLLNLKKVVPSNKSNYVGIDRDHWIASIYPKLADIFLDETWYLSRYPDVAEAIARGVIGSARQHYCQSGYFEHRLPYRIAVNEVWYLGEYRDVQAAIAHNVFASAQDHFEEIGYREGRHPHPGFALRSANDGPLHRRP